MDAHFAVGKNTILSLNVRKLCLSKLKWFNLEWNNTMLEKDIEQQNKFPKV